MTLARIVAFAFALVLLGLPAPGDAANINVQTVDLQRTDIEVTITAVEDSKYDVAGKVVKARKLGEALKDANGGEVPKYVLVEGNATVGHLFEAAKVGNRAGFTTLFEKDGEFRSIEALN